jgi:hypothetical protein
MPKKDRLPTTVTSSDNGDRKYPLFSVEKYQGAHKAKTKVVINLLLSMSISLPGNYSLLVSNNSQFNREGLFIIVPFPGERNP